MGRVRRDARSLRLEVVEEAAAGLNEAVVLRFEAVPEFDELKELTGGEGAAIEGFVVLNEARASNCSADFMVGILYVLPA